MSAVGTHMRVSVYACRCTRLYNTFAEAVACEHSHQAPKLPPKPVPLAAAELDELVNVLTLSRAVVVGYAKQRRNVYDNLLELNPEGACAGLEALAERCQETIDRLERARGAA